MTGPLLFGPAQAAPTGVPAPAQRPAQSVRSGASDFAGSLRSATQRREPASEAPEGRAAEPASDEAPPADRPEEAPAGEDGGERADEQGQRDTGAADDGERAAEQPDGEEDPVAAPVASPQRQAVSESGAPDEGDAGDEADRPAVRRAARAIVSRAPEQATVAETDGNQLAREAARTTAAGAAPRAEHAGAQQPGAGSQTGAAGSTGALLTGDGAETVGDPPTEQNTGQREGARTAAAPTRPESSGAFAPAAEDAGARRAAESAPADEPAPVRPQAPTPAHAPADGARPQSLRLESAPTPAPSAGAAGQSAEAADDSAAMQAMQRGLGAAVRQRGGSVTIRLSPESMGQVRIEMTIRQGTVDVRFEASTEQARELLTRHADMLRSTLHQKGFGVERIDVHANPAPTNGSRAGADASADQQQRRAPEQDAAGGESRGAFGGRGEDRRGDGWRHDDEAQTFEQWRVRVNATA